jgi:hypothetical protein
MGEQLPVVLLPAILAGQHSFGRLFSVPYLIVRIRTTHVKVWYSHYAMLHFMHG